MSAGHSHGSHRAGNHDDVQVARGPRTVLLGFILLASLASCAGLVMLWPSTGQMHRVIDAVDFAAPGVTFPDAVVLKV